MNNEAILNMKKLTYYTLGFVIILGLAGVTAWLAGNVATYGSTLETLKVQQQELERQNSELTAQILDKQSVNYLSKKAEALGYVQPDKFVTVDEPVSAVALR